MKSPILVVMAAGLGSRYGGLKQIAPLGPDGQIILDYSIYDAHRAGFRKVVFIIKPELEATFEDVIGAKTRKLMEVEYAFQTTEILPQSLHAPDGREKPLGTGHAVWCAMDAIDGAPFAVINADDFYGADAFSTIFQFLQSTRDDRAYCMVGYAVENTLTDHGTVARGVCTVTAQGMLSSIIERTKISKDQGKIIFTDAEGGEIAQGTPVSMNLWGFPGAFCTALTAQLHDFFAGKLQTDPMKAEFYLPSAVSAQMEAGQAQVTVLTTSAQWYGVTYQDDRPVVQQALQHFTARGIYPAVF